VLDERTEGAPSSATLSQYVSVSDSSMLMTEQTVPWKSMSQG